MDLPSITKLECPLQGARTREHFYAGAKAYRALIERLLRTWKADVATYFENDARSERQLIRRVTHYLVEVKGLTEPQIDNLTLKQLRRRLPVRHFQRFRGVGSIVAFYLAEIYATIED